MTEQEVIKQLQDLINYDYRQADMAKDAGVSSAYLSAVLKGRKRPSDAILKLIGVEKTKTITYSYVKVKE